MATPPEVESPESARSGKTIKYNFATAEKAESACRGIRPMLGKGFDLNYVASGTLNPRRYDICYQGKKIAALTLSTDPAFAALDSGTSIHKAALERIFRLMAETCNGREEKLIEK